MAKKGRGILLVYADVNPEHEEEFNTWYDTEHLPQLLSIPGFLDAARYVAVKGGPKYLAAYELESADVLKSSEFVNRRRPPSDARLAPSVIGQNYARIAGQQIYPADVEHADRGMAPALQIGRMSIPEGMDDEWNSWYNDSYIPGYRQVPGVIYARRYRVVDGDVRYTTVYEFENVEVPDTQEWDYQRQHSSPKSGQMRDIMTMAPGSPGVYRRMRQ